MRQTIVIVAAVALAALGVILWVNLKRSPVTIYHPIVTSTRPAMVPVRHLIGLRAEPLKVLRTACGMLLEADRVHPDPSETTCARCRGTQYYHWLLVDEPE